MHRRPQSWLPSFRIFWAGGACGARSWLRREWHQIARLAQELGITIEDINGCTQSHPIRFLFCAFFAAMQRKFSDINECPKIYINNSWRFFSIVSYIYQVDMKKTITHILLWIVKESRVVCQYSIVVLHICKMKFLLLCRADWPLQSDTCSTEIHSRWRALPRISELCGSVVFDGNIDLADPTILPQKDD